MPEGSKVPCSVIAAEEQPISHVVEHLAPLVSFSRLTADADDAFCVAAPLDTYRRFIVRDLMY